MEKQLSPQQRSDAELRDEDNVAQLDSSSIQTKQRHGFSEGRISPVHFRFECKVLDRLAGQESTQDEVYWRSLWEVSKSLPCPENEMQRLKSKGGATQLSFEGFGCWVSIHVIGAEFL